MKAWELEEEWKKIIKSLTERNEGRWHPRKQKF
jgi:hypothetical protein